MKKVSLFAVLIAAVMFSCNNATETTETAAEPTTTEVAAEPATEVVAEPATEVAAETPATETPEATENK